MLRKVVNTLPVTARKKLKAWRAEAFIRMGSSRYSWPALNGIDRKMVALLPDEGTYLEVGGNDGYSQSNTFYLERHRHWDGILIEPIPGLFQLARSARPKASIYNLACVPPECAGRPIEIVDLDLTSVALGMQEADAESRRLQVASRLSVNVATSTLSAVIEHSKLLNITFMSIDVEGAELELLRGLDLDRHTPDFMLVETDSPTEVAKLLKTMKFDRQLSHHDYLFVRS